MTTNQIDERRCDECRYMPKCQSVPDDNSGCDIWKGYAPRQSDEAAPGDVVRLTDLDAAFEAEIARVSTVEYNSNEICRWFFKNIRAALTALPPSPLPEEVKEVVADLRSLSAWLLEHDVDLRLPVGMRNPSKAAALLTSQSNQLAFLKACTEQQAKKIDSQAADNARKDAEIGTLTADRDDQRKMRQHYEAQVRERDEAIAALCDELGCDHDNESALRTAADLRAQVRALTETLEKAQAALVEIRDLKERPYEGFPADWREQIDNCPECQKYAGHPVQQGICDTHRKPMYARERHDKHETSTLGIRASWIARDALYAMKPTQEVSEQRSESVRTVCGRCLGWPTTYRNVNGCDCPDCGGTGKQEG